MRRLLYCNRGIAQKIDSAIATAMTRNTMHTAVKCSVSVHCMAATPSKLFKSETSREGRAEYDKNEVHGKLIGCRAFPVKYCLMRSAMKFLAGDLFVVAVVLRNIRAGWSEACAASTGLM